jgi:hypothetical protein
MPCDSDDPGKLQDPKAINGIILMGEGLNCQETIIVNTLT